MLQIFVPYTRYVHYLKWITLALFSFYVAVVFVVHVSWSVALRATFLAIVLHTIRLLHRLNRGSRNNHQSLSFFLASLGRSRGRADHSGRSTAEAEAPASPGSARPHSRGYCDRHGLLEHRGLFHHPHNGDDTSRPRPNRHSNSHAGREGHRTARRPLHFSIVRGGRCGHRYAGHSGSCRLGRVWSQ